MSQPFVFVVRFLQFLIYKLQNIGCLLYLFNPPSINFVKRFLCLDMFCEKRWALRWKRASEQVVCVLLECQLFLIDFYLIRAQFRFQSFQLEWRDCFLIVSFFLILFCRCCCCCCGWEIKDRCFLFYDWTSPFLSFFILCCANVITWMVLTRFGVTLYQMMRKRIRKAEYKYFEHSTFGRVCLYELFYSGCCLFSQQQDQNVWQKAKTREFIWICFFLSRYDFYEMCCLLAHALSSAPPLALRSCETRLCAGEENDHQVLRSASEICQKRLNILLEKNKREERGTK